MLVPGLPVLPLNVERHPVPGGGTRTLALDAGDELTVVDREGRQPCELVVFDPGGRADPALIGAKGTGAPLGIQAILDRPTPSAKRVRDALAARGLDLGRAAAVRLFGDESRAGESASFVATAPATLVAGAPGGPMPADAQCPPTEIVLYVRCGSRTNLKPANSPPPPLADPLIDLDIQPGTARGYEIRAGQFIQLVDVKGRECSDFQAFSLRALDRGLEREIDPTTTRSLMGSLYPGPGLYSKYYTVDHEPLLELVQDTCGRHDSFGVACTARYYEDLGYPGHVNCSDNINAEGERYGIRPRGGWPAINFIFNTTLDDANAIGMDDPWSRPGDFVLMRALTDLVFSVARLGDYHGMALVVSRTGYTGELGYELFCHPKDARTLFEAVMEAGERFGIAPLGLGALDMLRIEAGLVFAGAEFSDQTDPFEAGIGFTVPLKSKAGDFIGREALARRKSHPVRKLVGLDLKGGLVPSTGDCVRVGRAQIGEITSAVRSPILGKVIALCRMDVAHAVPGTEVEVGQLDGHQKRIPARVVPFPHFDPEKRRVHGDYA